MTEPRCSQEFADASDSNSVVAVDRPAGLVVAADLAVEAEEAEMVEEEAILFEVVDTGTAEAEVEEAAAAVEPVKARLAVHGEDGGGYLDNG